MNNEQVDILSKPSTKENVFNLHFEKKINSEATYVCVKANLLSNDIEKRNGYKIIRKFPLLKSL